jgi:hypothetical protein
MSPSTHNPPISKDSSSIPVIHLSYECVVREHGRESSSYLYEIACSITYPMTSAYLSVRVTGQNTYRNAAAREAPFTRHELGATTFVELLEAERLEVRIVDREGAYFKAIYYAHGQELIEQNVRQVVSSIHQIASEKENETGWK